MVGMSTSVEAMPSGLNEIAASHKQIQPHMKEALKGMADDVAQEEKRGLVLMNIRSLTEEKDLMPQDLFHETIKQLYDQSLASLNK